MNIYNITSKNEKKETIHKNGLKIVAAKNISPHIVLEAPYAVRHPYT